MHHAKVDDWKILLLMDKFEQELDGMDKIAYRLKEKISKEAWVRVKDLFYYDVDCEGWLTQNPVEVIERLKDNEWELEVKVFERIAGSISLNNAELLYQCMKIVKKATPAVIDLIQRATKSVAGDKVVFSEGTKVISDEFNDYSKTEKIIVEKEGERYVVFLVWMASLDDVGFYGLVWKEDDVKSVDDEVLKRAVETDLAAAFVFMPVVEIVEHRKEEGKAYIIKKVTKNNPIKNEKDEYYLISFWHEASNPDSYDYKASGETFASYEEAKSYVKKLLNSTRGRIHS